jgi:uncharacterized membrane protein
MKEENSFTIEKLRELDQFLRVRDEDMNLVRAHGLLTCLISLPEKNYNKLDHYEIFFNNDLDQKYNKYIPKVKETLIEILKTTSANLSNEYDHGEFNFIFSTAGFTEISNEVTLEQMKDWCIGYVLGLYWSGMLDAIQEGDRDSSVFGACSTIMFYADVISSNSIAHTPEKMQEIDNIKLASMANLPKLVRSLYAIWSHDLQNIKKSDYSAIEGAICPCGSNKQYAMCCRLEAITEILH